MVKRKCGTCRHFKDGGIAGSGWCNHPARRELHHMVLVRKTELGCRNNWDQDLWEPALDLVDEPDAADDRVPTPTHLSTTSVTQPAPPATDGEMFTDRLTSISIAAPRNASPSDAETDSGGEDEPIERSDVRAARRRRVEQIERDRQQQQRDRRDEARRLLESPSPAPAKPASKELPTPAPTPVDMRPSPPPRQPTRVQPARPPIPPPPPTPTRERQTPVSPPEPRRTAHPGIDERGSTSIRFGTAPESFQKPRDPAPSAPPSLTSRERRDARTAPIAPQMTTHQETDDLPIAEVRSQTRRDEVRAEERPQARPEQPQPSRERSAVEPPIDDRDPRWLIWAGQIDGEHQRRVEADPRPHEDEARREHLPTAMPADPLDAAGRNLAVPRCCATCRDFRPVGDGATGWCANPYAFTSKRMVESSDLACRSTIGSWWLPSDEVWLDHADATHHSRPTPLLDELRRPDYERDRESPSHPS